MEKSLLILHQILSARLQHTHRHKSPLYKPHVCYFTASSHILGITTTHFQASPLPIKPKAPCHFKISKSDSKPKLAGTISSNQTSPSRRPYLLASYLLASLTLSHFRALMLRHPPHLRLRFAPFVTIINRHRVPSQNYPLGASPLKLQCPNSIIHLYNYKHFVVLSIVSLLKPSKWPQSNKKSGSPDKSGQAVLYFNNQNFSILAFTYLSILL